MTEALAAAPANGDVEESLNLPSLSFTTDDYDLLDEPPGPVIHADEDDEPTPSHPQPTPQPPAEPHTQPQPPPQQQSTDSSSPPPGASDVVSGQLTERGRTTSRTMHVVHEEDESEVEFETAPPAHPTTSAPAAHSVPATPVAQPAAAVFEDKPQVSVQLSPSASDIQPAASLDASRDQSFIVEGAAAEDVDTTAATASAAADELPSTSTHDAVSTDQPPASSDLASASPAVNSAAPTNPARTSLSSTSTSLSSAKPTHRSRPSLLTFDRNKTTLNLDALNLVDPLDYLRMLRTVLTLQRKCRTWRTKIRAKIKARVEAEKAKQEQEMQLKLHNKRQQRKLSEAFRTSHAHLPQMQPDEPSQVEPSPVPVKRKLWSVDLPDSEEHRLKFTLCMMKIQRAFRGKLVRARVRLQEKLKADKEQQEKEMADKLEKRRAAKQAKAEQQQIQQQTQQQDEATPEESKETVSLLPSIPLPVQAVGEEVLQGSLTSRLRKDRERRREEREKDEAERRARMVDSQVQVDVDELRETAALDNIPASSLFVPLTSPRPASRTASQPPSMAVAVVPDHRLKEQHLRILALLSTVPVVPPVRVTVGEVGVVGYVVGEQMCELEWVSEALYERVFGGRTVDGMAEDEDWESIVHLPLPATVPPPVPASPVIEL